ncbi:hypothetical protein [uncultured Cohaesibacter sp.]|nr:hypothetical protein [uncultured Cohaesibacter sp.]
MIVSFSRHTSTPLPDVMEMGAEDFVLNSRALAKVVAAEAPKRTR